MADRCKWLSGIAAGFSQSHHGWHMGNIDPRSCRSPESESAVWTIPSAIFPHRDFASSTFLDYRNNIPYELSHEVHDRILRTATMAHYRDEVLSQETAHHDNIMSALLERFSKWLQLKIYQIEVTFCVYIFTPAEKFIFCMFFSLPSLAPSFFPVLSVLLVGMETNNEQGP
jgi:hypothetical protein